MNTTKPHYIITLDGYGTVWIDPATKQITRSFLGGPRSDGKTGSVAQWADAIAMLQDVLYLRSNLACSLACGPMSSGITREEHRAQRITSLQELLVNAEPWLPPGADMPPTEEQLRFDRLMADLRRRFDENPPTSSCEDGSTVNGLKARHSKDAQGNSVFRWEDLSGSIAFESR